MIQSAMIKITVDTNKAPTEDWATFELKAEPKVPQGVEEITMQNYPAVLIAGIIMQRITREITAAKKPV